MLLLAEPAELRGDAARMFATLPLRPILVRGEQELERELRAAWEPPNSSWMPFSGPAFARP